MTNLSVIISDIISRLFNFLRTCLQMDEDLFAVFEDDSNTATDKTVNTKPTNKDAKLEYVLKYY